MSTIAIPTIDDFIAAVQRRSTEVERGTGLLWPLKFSWEVIMLNRESKKTIALMRAMMNECAETCPEAGCMTKRYERSAFIREELRKIHSQLVAKSVPKVTLHIFENMLSEWDDLAEDCAISSDPEIRELITSISSKL